jgi:hypothetical protein
MRCSLSRVREYTSCAAAKFCFFLNKSLDRVLAAMAPKHAVFFVSILVCIPLTAAAGDQDDALVSLRSQVGWGNSVNPDRIGASTEGGWNGGDRRTEVDATVEATIVSRTSVFATAQYGGDLTNARPAIGVGYQLVDPRTGPNGVRVTVAYKPEGFTEPEGEIESVVVGTRQVGDDTVRAMAAYGQDPEGAESDAEVGASYIHRAAPNLVIGATSRFRHAIKVKTIMEPRWDFIAGGVGSIVRGRSRLELLLGIDSIAYTPNPAHSGFVGLASIGTEL